MRTLAIGDIHGCSRALDRLLELVAPRPDDLVITLGDYVDRGPDTRGVLVRLLGLSRRCRHVALRGNHELMMLAAYRHEQGLDSWLALGGSETLASYAPAGQEGRFEDIPDRHWHFLEQTCQPYYETDAHLFVHANAYPNLPLAQQPDYMLYWEPFVTDWSRPHDSGKTLICGHTSQRSGLPLDLGHAVCIDTRVYGATGWLTCLDVTTGRLWQASEAGDARTGWRDTLPEFDPQ
jgi:serine/threonine protein phosphatase 1